MQLIALVLSSIAFVTTVQGANPQICCPKTMSKYANNDGATNFKSASVNPEGNLVCSYEGQGYDGSENPYCEYTPVPRETTTSEAGEEMVNTIKPGELIGQGGLSCAEMSPAKGPGSAACTSEFCCPSHVFGALQSSTYQTKSGRDTFWCGYAADKGCEYYADSGKLTFTYSQGACPDMASTGKTCIINQ